MRLLFTLCWDIIYLRFNVKSVSKSYFVTMSYKLNEHDACRVTFLIKILKPCYMDNGNYGFFRSNYILFSTR